MAAARVIGDSNFQIVFRHVLPNVLPSIIVRATLGISSAILDSAALGFLGLGVQPPAAEWGDMLGRGRNELFRAPWLMIFPWSRHHASVLAFNLLGDGVRDGLDPKQGRGSPMLLRSEEPLTEVPVKRGIVRAVDDVSFDVSQGEILAIVGRVGSGQVRDQPLHHGLLAEPGHVAGG